MTNLAQTPGVRRVMNTILDYAERHDGALPHSRTFKHLSASEVEEIRLGFRTSCVRQLGPDRIQLNVDRVLAQEYYNDSARLKEAWYQHCQRTPRDLNEERRQRVQALLHRVGARPASPTLERLVAQIGEGGHWAEELADEEGIDAAVGEVETVATVLEELPNLRSPERVRDLSARLFQGDTKRFGPDRSAYRRVTDELERLKPEVAAALRADGSRAWRRALLEQHNVIQNATEVTVLLIGPLVVQYGDGRDETVLAAARRGHACVLTLDQVNALGVPDPVVALVTIENPTTFNNLASTELAKEAVLVCTDGFPNEATQRLVRKIRVARHLHWGDIDPAGFDIAATTGAVGAENRIFMDAAAIQAYASRLTRFKEGQEALFQARRAGLDAVAQGALQECLGRGAFLEQENVPVSVAVAGIAERLGLMARLSASAA